MSTDCPFFLLQALPFAFITEANHYIAHSAVRNNLIPPIVRMTKQYYKPHVEEVKRQLESAKELASAEEWTKGLARQGQERLEDILRWEQWESKGGLKKVNLRPSPKATIAGAVTAGSRSTSEKGEYHSNRSTPQSMAFSTRFEAGQPSPGPSLALGSARLASNLVPRKFARPY